MLGSRASAVFIQLCDTPFPSTKEDKVGVTTSEALQTPVPSHPCPQVALRPLCVCVRVRVCSPSPSKGRS